ncbi:GTP-binding protein, partial [Rhizobium ruizarguesonis]
KSDDSEMAEGKGRLRKDRDRHRGPERVTAIDGFEAGRVHGAESLRAGQMARISGLAGVRIGDAVGGDPAGGLAHFAPPT